MCYEKASSQGFNQNSAFWSEFNLTVKTKSKFSYQLDYQYRRQGESERLRESINLKSETGEHEKPGIFAYPNQIVVRPWIQYKLNNTVRLALSPIGWWGTWTPTGLNTLSFRPEFRTTLQVSAFQSVGRVSLTHRFRYEFRFIGKNLPTDGSKGDNYYSDMLSSKTRQARFRYMLRAVVPITKPKLDPKTYYLNISDEAHIGIGHNVKRERVFDQNRFFMGLGYKFSSALRVELGYINQIVPRGTYKDMNSGLYASVLVDDFNGLFHKEDKAQ